MRPQDRTAYRRHREAVAQAAEPDPTVLWERTPRPRTDPYAAPVRPPLGPEERKRLNEKVIGVVALLVIAFLVICSLTAPKGSQPQASTGNPNYVTQQQLAQTAQCLQQHANGELGFC
jgi:hypothetical protein